MRVAQAAAATLEEAKKPCCQSGTGAEDVCAAQPASVSGPGGPGPPAIQMEQLCLSDIAGIVAEEMRIPASERQITIETEIQPDVCSAPMRRS